MKNQYVGDINDYRKYGILRAFTRDAGLSTTICWMLTSDDGSSDGSRRTYLNDPSWRKHDPELFTFLGDVVRRGVFDVHAVQDGAVLGTASFFGDLLPEEPMARTDYFRELAKLAQRRRLIYLDTDNGMGVLSVPLGSRGSAKYLYMNEVQFLWNEGFSLLLYQHFPRSPRGPYLGALTQRLAEAIYDTHKLPMVRSFVTPNQALLLLAQPRDAQEAAVATSAVRRRWHGAIAVHSHVAPFYLPQPDGVAALPIEEARA